MTTVTEAILSRRSSRVFLDAPVAESDVRAILELARQSPSSSNMQPWKLTVMTGDDLSAFKIKARASLAASPKGEGSEYNLYARPLKEIYDLRRRKCAEDMYASIKVGRDDRPARLQQFSRNFDFFDAPVGMILSIDRSHEVGQWLDMGIFLQTLMLAATERGLATCPQAAWAMMPNTIRDHIYLPPEYMVVCGLALGFADPAAAINAFEVGRMPFMDFIELRGFSQAA